MQSVDEDVRVSYGDAPEQLSSLPGAPDGWSWREQQREITQQILDSDKKVVILQAEPGSGKTTIAWAALSANPLQRGVVLVQTRQLEEQYLRDFTQLRMIQGRRWYPCQLGIEETGNDVSADEGPCTIGYRCEYAGIRERGGGYVVSPTCDYFATKLEATKAPISVHNYSYWLNETRYNPRTEFTGVDWIVCDEAHDLQSILMDAEVVTFDRAVIRELGMQPISRGGLAEVQQWALDNHGIVQEAHDDVKRRAIARGLITDELVELEEPTDFDGAQGWDSATSQDARELVRDLRHLANLLGDLDAVTSIPEADYDEWIIDRTKQAYLSVCPLYGKRGFRRIMASGRKIVLMSAYLAPKLLVENLGLTEGEYEIIEADEIYDRRKSKIYYCGTIKMKYATSDAMWRQVTGCIDSFIEHYAPESGFIHVPSTALRNRIRLNSKHQDVLITYDGDNDPNREADAPNKAAALDYFKNGEGQRVLLGQSTATGVDVPYVPRFNIIVKVAFPPTKDPVVEARMKRDKSYYNFLTICQVVQAAGRAKRASDHHCETIILDKQFGWFYAANAQHFPKWFNNSLQRNGWKNFPPVRLSMKRKGVSL